MNTHRLLSFLIISAALLAAEGIALFASVPKAIPGIDFPTEIIITVPATVPEQRLNTIVTNAGGVLLGPEGLPSGVPGDGTWAVEVTGAKSKSDTTRVLAVRGATPDFSTMMPAEEIVSASGI